jgi:hypothetical protein
VGYARVARGSSGSNGVKLRYEEYMNRQRDSNGVKLRYEEYMNRQRDGQ